MILLSRETTVARVTSPTAPPPSELDGAAPTGDLATSPRRIVVVGAGLAATQTVGALREAGFDGHLTVLGGEGRAPYDRPPLSKHLLDRTEPAWLSQELGVDVVHLADDARLAEPATGLRVAPDEVVVRTASGGEVSADAVVLATGARARRVPGWEHALVLHTADDAAALRARVVPGARLVVIGAGWIGAEVAGVAAAVGARVTVLEAGPAPLAGAVGARVGALATGWFADAGVELRTGAQVAGVDEDGVLLADGTHVPADVVLAAVGARPATDWLGDALPRDLDGSLRVDEHHAVIGASRRVRAVGDVARRRSRRHGWVPGGHWDGALRGPAILAADLVRAGGTAGTGADDAGHGAGNDTGNGTGHGAGSGTGSGRAAAAADPVPYVFSTQLGHDLTLFGLPDEADDVVLRGDPSDGEGWSALWFRAGEQTLSAILTVDRPRDVGAARRLFGDLDLPRLDRDVAAVTAQPLRAAQVR